MAMYDSRQMNKMRQYAIRRSHEMYRRSSVNTEHFSQGQAKSDEHEKPAGKHEYEHESKPSLPPVTVRSNEKKDISGLLRNIFGEKLDSDKLLIAVLILILAKDGADKKLLIALGYILL